ncbi:MAG: tetratricopeptide repeat protein [Candidatus Obscuribacterales bacterium]|nr:tetratricopeptide repeat protein [Candidatus Obscuribacterales bacterium]
MQKLPAKNSCLAFSCFIVLFLNFAQPTFAASPVEDNIIYGVGSRFQNLHGGMKTPRLEELEAAIKKKPQDAIAYVRRGAYHLDDGEMLLADKDFNKAISLDKNCAEAYIGKNRVAQFKLHNLEAQKYLEKAAAVGSANVSLNAAWEQAFLLRESRNYEKSLELFNKALSIPDKNKSRQAYILYQRGESLARLGRLDEALKDYNNCINLNSRLADAYHMRANVYTMQKKYDLALADLAKVIYLNKNSTRMGRDYFAGHSAAAYEDRARIFEKLGKPELAAKERKERAEFEKSRFEATPFRAF